MKYSLINEEFDFHEGDQIIFEMPSFCSGEYGALVHEDPSFGYYIPDEDNYFKGCRSYSVIRGGKTVL